MVYLSLQQQIFNEIHMKIDMKEKTQIEIESRFSFSVSYNEDNSACIAVLRQEVREKNDPSQFNVVVESQGHYICEGISNDDEKKIAHVQSYCLLFPYVQNMIARLVSSAGLPPLMIKMEKMTSDNIKLESKQS